ncbi:Ubiquitin-conjugating enzyme family protein [Thalictrum thalictroides]|uniref:Ubiquitin-conjugating enzyme family protein n=1 Tax=Thalictrum thalictroides TaxID=46969 RepID=A0A7J6WTU4_THATH|nr:Ubiquitin-conjugating enzyme family protein [Thalictrum thalictroides]
MEMFLSDSDSESSSQSSCSDYLEDIDSMYGGQAQSILSNLERSIGKIDDFLAFERGFMHGDIVCYETDPSGQLGRVIGVDTVVDLETAHGEIVNKVDCKKLLKVCPFVVGDYVVHGPWLGRVSRVVDRLTILFDDGATCEVTAIIPDDIRPICTSVLEDSQYLHYPGQHVQIRISSVLKSARWLCGEWKENRTEGTVCRVEAGMVYVDWVASAIIHCDFNVPAPPCLQEPKDLTLLSCFTHANWQLGDWCILMFDNQSIGEKQVLNGCGTEHISEHFGKGLLQGIHKNSYETIYVIVKKRTKVDVLWQDGTRSIGLDSQCLLPVNSVGDHEFWPEQFVLEKSSDDQHFASIQRSGYVKSVDAKERTVRLKWTTHARNDAYDSDENCNEETVSVYELVEHPDYSYCLGEIVFRLGKTLSVIPADGQSECEGLLTTDTRSGSVKQFKEDYNTSKQASESSLKYENMCYLSCIGNVIGFEDEGIVVTWASGLTSKVAPWEIVGIDKYEHPVAVPVLYEEDTEDKLTQEMPEYDKRFSHRKDKDVVEYTGNSVGGDYNKDTWETRCSLISQAAIGFLKKIAVSLFDLDGSTSLSNSMESSPLSNLDANEPPLTTGIEIESLYDKVKTKCSNLITVPLPSVDDVQTDIKRQVEEPQEPKTPCCSYVSDIPAQFKQFDTVDVLLDHYYVHGVDKESMLPQVKRGWLKKVQQEWSILEKDLPDTIYVRVCEQRIDLLRAAIVGAPGTPYQDGLFFFDFYLPAEYPNEPPMVHYHSGGLRLNPNLSMLYVLSKPPKHFEALVEEHFSRHSHSILLACKAYMDGAPVGYAFGSESAVQKTQNSSSTGFKLMLAKLFPKLISCFTDKGFASCRLFESGFPCIEK